MEIRHTFRNGILTLFEYSGAAYAYRSLVKKGGPLTRVVVFHDVPDREWFKEMIEVLARETNVLTPNEFRAGVRNEARLNTLITFDDGYASWIEVALPVLEQYNFRALFFINSGLLDGAHEKEATDRFMREGLQIRPRKPLTWDGAQKLVESGHMIGGHARTHADLTKLESSTLEHELLNDRSAFTEQLGISVTEFAYPFGTRRHVNDAVAYAVRHAGYERAYTAVSRFVRPQTDAYHIPRMCIEDGLTSRQLRTWLNGSYDLFDSVKSVCAR